MIDEKLLEEYMNNFYGYGNLKGKYWFIGMEEGGGNSEDEFISRLQNWKCFGSPTLLDNCKFHSVSNDGKGNNMEYFFRETKTKYQPTWGGLIKILLNYFEYKQPTLEQVKQFQSKSWGRVNSDNCLLEVFPLPSPKAGKWKYSDWIKNIHYLESRESYKEKLKETRIQKLKDLILAEKPLLVVFYSSNKEYLEYWYKIIGVSFQDLNFIDNENKLKAKFIKQNNFCYAIIHHPTFQGITNEYFEKVGAELRKLTSL